MLTRANKVVETRDVAWETPPVVVVPLVQLQHPASAELAGAPELGRTSEPGRAPELAGASESGGASELGDTPEPGGLDDFDSAPPTPLPLLGRGIPHRRRVTPPMGSAGHGGEGERSSVGGEDATTPATTTALSGVYQSSVSSEPSVDGERSVEGTETS